MLKIDGSLARNIDFEVAITWWFLSANGTCMYLAAGLQVGCNSLANVVSFVSSGAEFG